MEGDEGEEEDKEGEGEQGEGEPEEEFKSLKETFCPETVVVLKKFN